MWESPITMITENIARDIISKTDGMLVEYVHAVGFDVDKEELEKALAYDRGQYEKGYSDGRTARDAEIVRCKDCIHRPHKEEDGYVYEPDGGDFTCPCLCEDCYYNWMPEDDFFCKRGERRDDAEQ